LRVITFHVPGHDSAAAIASLVELGFVFGPQQTVTTTLVDTFDGRLHRAGLRLELRRSEALELVLSGDGIVPAHLAVAKAPRVLADLAPGPFRSRIATLTDVRALLPQLRVRMTRSTGLWRDATGKAVAVAELNEGVHVLGRRGSERFTTIEIHPLPGYAQQARRGRELLEGIGLETSALDTLALCAAATGVDLGGFSAAATVPLDPQMAAIDGFRAVLANLEVAISANWQGAIDQTDIKFLHDLRIAVRRTRTVLSAAKNVLPAAVLEPAVEGFAWLAGSTGAPRDLDVYLLEWERYTDSLWAETFSALTPVRDLLIQRHTDAHIELERVLRSDRAAELITEWRRWLNEPLGDDDVLPRRAGRPLGKVVAKRVARDHTALVDDGRLIGPDTPPEQVHDLRKDAKKLRYLVECFASLLPDKPRKKYVRHLKALQENLGAHQDADVHLALLHSVTVELDRTAAGPAATGQAATRVDTLVAIGQLIERLDQSRIAARAEFAERFADYDSPATHRALDAMLATIRS
jgi:CHAD domain-containing protein